MNIKKAIQKQTDKIINEMNPDRQKCNITFFLSGRATITALERFISWGNGPEIKIIMPGKTFTLYRKHITHIEFRHPTFTCQHCTEQHGPCKLLRGNIDDEI